MNTLARTSERKSARGSASYSARKFGALAPRDLVVWAIGIAIAALAPLVFDSRLSITVLSQIGIAIVACLAYNMLLGQGGMLSFGHAVYSGLGSFVAIHALRAAGNGSLPIPVSLMPLVGGVAGFGFAVLFGFVTTKKAGTTFAMITLGIGELVFAASLMIPEFFGGEAGISANRVVGKAVLGIDFASQLQVYYLLAVYTVVCTVGIYAFTRTPLGRMLNAVRDNPERVEFIGYDTQRVRFLAFMISGFFAGVAGGMYALNFEIATAEVVGAARSGAYLLFTFLGGATFFFGPIIGGVLMVLASVLLSEFTKAWLLYLGLIFMLMVMYAPGGIASLIMMNLRVAQFGQLGRVAGWYALLALTGLITFCGAGAIIEMIYHIQFDESSGSTTPFFGLALDVAAKATWAICAVVAVVGAILFEATRRRFARRWDAVQEEIEAAIRARETA